MFCDVTTSLYIRIIKRESKTARPQMHKLGNLIAPTRSNLYIEKNGNLNISSTCEGIKPYTSTAVASYRVYCPFRLFLLAFAPFLVRVDMAILPMA